MTFKKDKELRKLICWKLRWDKGLGLQLKLQYCIIFAGQILQKQLYFIIFTHNLKNNLWLCMQIEEGILNFII